MKYLFIYWHRLLCLALCIGASSAVFAQTDDSEALGNAPIAFYGRILDEKNKPVEGAEVHAEILLGYWISPNMGAQKHEEMTLTTDSQGEFAITNKVGTSLCLKRIEKAGYKLSAKVGTPTYLYHPVKRVSDPQRPEIFHMWKKRGGEQLIQPREWTGSVSCDGTTNRFDLERGTEDKNGALEIVCTRNPAEILPREGKHYDYSISVTLRGGGIRPTEEEFTYIAPEEGYATDFIESKKAGEAGWRGHFVQEFYVKTAEGHFGRLTIDWYNWQQNPTHLHWNCSVNPSKSRNLER